MLNYEGLIYIYISNIYIYLNNYTLNYEGLMGSGF